MNFLTIFVLTYNRAEMLDQALRSILNQSAKGFRVVILDNGSTDHTREVVRSYERFGFEYEGTDGAGNRGQLWNFFRAIEKASSKWTMLFHDDDVIHPNYIEYAVHGLESHQNAVLCCSGNFDGTSPPEKWLSIIPDYVYGNVHDLANFIYSGLPIAFCSAIYKTECMKRVPIQMKKFGKYSDRPWLLDIASHGNVIIFKSPMIFTRKHPGQDTTNISNNLSMGQMLALHKKYHEILGSNLSSKYGRSFLKHNLFQVISMYPYYDKSHQSRILNLFTYIVSGIRTGALAWPSLILGVPYLTCRIVKHLRKS